jgi:hypothetical protein
MGRSPNCGKNSNIFHITTGLKTGRNVGINLKEVKDRFICTIDLCHF